MKHSSFKNLGIALAALTLVASSALADGNRKPASTNGITNPEGAVQHSAHLYIAENADLGGEVTSPCLTNLAGDLLTVSCSGVYHTLGPGGGGNFPVKFKCVGKFVQGQNAIFAKQGKASCNDE